MLVQQLSSANTVRKPDEQSVGGVTKTLLTGSATQNQSARPDFQINVVHNGEAQIPSVPPAERLYRAVEV